MAGWRDDLDCVFSCEQSVLPLDSEGSISKTPSSISPRLVTLSNLETATIIPFFSEDIDPPRLLDCLHDHFNEEVEAGTTLPFTVLLSARTFSLVWFGSFAAVMVLGDVGGVEAINAMDQDENLNSTVFKYRNLLLTRSQTISTS